MEPLSIVSLFTYGTPVILLFLLIAWVGLVIYYRRLSHDYTDLKASIEKMADALGKATGDLRAELEAQIKGMQERLDGEIKDIKNGIIWNDTYGERKATVDTRFVSVEKRLERMEAQQNGRG